MASREFKYEWEWRLKSSPEALWPLISDTNRFSSATGVASIQSRPVASRWGTRAAGGGLSVERFELWTVAARSQ